MDTSKVSQGQLIAAVGGAVLIISLFLDWISGITVQIGATSVSGGGGSAFDVCSGMDIIMLLVGIAAIGVAAAAATDSAGALPINTGWILMLLGVGAVGWTLGWDLEVPSAGIGAWLGLVASVAIAIGGVQASTERRPVSAAASERSVPAPPTATVGSSGPPSA